MTSPHQKNNKIQNRKEKTKKKLKTKQTKPKSFLSSLYKLRFKLKKSALYDLLTATDKEKKINGLILPRS